MMQTIEQKEYNKTIPGWLSEWDMIALAKLSSSRRTDATIVELGSMHGKSAYCMATSAPWTNVICYDLWPGHGILGPDKITRENTIELFQSYTNMCKNITPIRINSIDDIQWNISTPVDMMFLDAAHTNPSDWEMIEYWLPKIVPGGIISGHDYYTEEVHKVIHYPDINENVARLEKILGKPVSLAHRLSSVWSFVV
jgi:predicted O-methyltransferase YrrM